MGADRETTYNKAWRVEEPNTFGTEEFLKWCKAVGCEPYICTNGGNGTSEEMGNWVEYCNGHYNTRFANMRRRNGNAAPHGVKYWGIGNESYGDWQIGAKTVAEWGPYVAESAKMMRAVDSEIILSVAAVPDLEWTSSLLRAAGDHLDLVSIHGYWDIIHQKNEPKDFLECMVQTESPEQMIRATRNVIGASGYEGKIRIAFDEWNLRGWHHPDGTSQQVIADRDKNDIAATYTMADAIFSAGFFNSCLRNADIVAMANVAPTVNARGPLFVHPEGIVKRTSFHTMKMYVQNTRKRVVASAVKSSRLEHGKESVAAVDALVSTDETGTTIAIVNRHPTQEAHCEVKIDGVPLMGAFSALVLDGASPDAFNDIKNPDAVTPRQTNVTSTNGEFLVPPHAIYMLRMD